ncbi:MAG: hypothetical protein INR71_00405 [Terriglobus roseus]|nr:hypothetical protein [Terriglobus roseus]
MSLCRHYVRELRRSVLIDTPELEKGSKRSSSGFDGTSDSGLAGPSGPGEKQATTPDQRLSAFLRSETQSRHSPTRSQDSSTSGTPAMTPGGMPKPAFANSTSNSGSPVTGTTGLDSSPGNISSSPQHTVNRADIRASAEKILYTFLLPGSEREIILPQGILNQITTAIEEQGRDDPEVFDDAKDYVFQAMERDAFPGFLRSKALGNIVPPSMMLRLIIGLLALFGAFWTAFVLIFLDYDRATRCWVCSLLPPSARV